MEKTPWEGLTALVREGLATIRRTNALAPVAWLCAIVSLPCFFFAFATKDPWLDHFLAVLGAAPPALFVFAYLFLLFLDRDRLHSEEFQLRSRALRTVEAKGGAVEILPVDVGITNPDPGPKRISGPGSQEDSDE